MASDEGRKRIPVFPPLQMQSGSNQKNRRRIAKAVNTTLEAAHHSHWYKPTRHLSLEVDRQVISHLKKRLVLRLEKRLNNLDDVEDQLDKRKTPVVSARRKRTTPKDIFGKYSEFGEKLTNGVPVSRGTTPPDTPAKLKPLDTTEVSISSRSNSITPSLSPALQEESDTVQSITPLPRIGSNSPGSRLSDQSSHLKPEARDTLQTPNSNQETKGINSMTPNSSHTGGNGIMSDSSHSSVSGVQQEAVTDTTDSAQLEREKSLFTLTKVAAEDPEEPDISPVATPVMFRPMTREETRLSLNDRMNRVLKGEVHVHCPPDDRTLKLFISSGFTDMEIERTVLQERVIPVLKQAALSQNYELEVYDLHWSLPDSVSDNHRVEQLCQQMVIQARESPFGPCFLLLLGEKYGPLCVPPSIPAEEFERILNKVNQERDRQMAAMAKQAAAIEAARVEVQLRRQEITESAEGLNVPESSRDLSSPQSVSPVPSEASSSSRLRQQAEIIRKEARVVKLLREDHSKMADKINEALDGSVLKSWYKLDTNTVPSVYRLQNISTHLGEFSRGDAMKRKHARSNWKAVSGRLMEILRTAVTGMDDPDLLNKYSMSLLELEIVHGVIEADDPDERCFVIRRTLEDLQQSLADTKTKAYLDINPKSKRVEIDSDKQERIEEIRHSIIPEHVDENLIKDFRVPWNSNGIQLSGHRGHHVYLEKLTKTVLDHLLSTLNPSSKGDNSRENSDKKNLFDEVCHHIRFCQQSARKFHGRKDYLMKLKSYLRSPANTPLVVHGTAGTGKTTLLAKAAKEVHKWFDGSSISVIYRAIAISEKSTNIRMLLLNICHQLTVALGMDTEDLPQDTKGIINDFTHKLSHVPEDNHVILFLDSLERLSEENEGRKLQWLPKELSPNVHIIVSTLPDEKYGCFKALTNMIPQNPQCYLELGELREGDAVAILDKWFLASERTLTDDQYEVLLEAFKKCPSPFYLDTAFQEVLSWPSYMDPEHVKLGETVKKIATIRFGKLEKDFGEPLVRRALGYITASRDGISSNEMEDLLSLDEVVMEDVKQKLSPLMRRLPSVLWINLREELMNYLMLCRAGTSYTLRWRHIQFQEAAEERYLLARDKAQSYHKALAEYFLGTWASTPKPHPGNEKGSMRFVADQGFYYESEHFESSQKLYNTRRMRELPHHLLNSQQLDVLKSSTLCNFEYMLAKLLATSLRALLEEYHNALTVEPLDKDLKLLADTLQLSQRALEKEPRQLGAQIAGRLNGIIARDVPATAADPLKYPCLKDLLNQITRSSIPTLMPSITCLTEPGGVLFDLLYGHSDVITAATLTTDGMRSITTAKDNTMKLWDLRSGRVVKTIDGVGKNVSLVKTGMANSLAITSEDSCIRIWSLRTGALVHTIDGFDDPAIITTASEGRLLVAVLDGVNTLKVWDLENNFNQRHEIDIKHAGVHQDNSAIVAGNPFGDQILFGARGTKVAYMQNARTGRLIHTVKCHDTTSLISCLAITRDYLVLGCRQPYMKLHETFILELFDIRRGNFLRNVRGCVHDNLQEIIINQIGSHAIAVCASEQNNMSDIALWNLETEDHKHLARHANVSKICVCLDFRFVLTAANSDKTLRIWNISGKVNLPAPKMKKFNGVGEIVPMVSNPRYVVAKAANNGPLSVWNVVKAKCLQNAVRIERGLVDPSDILLVRNSKIVILTDRGFSNVSDKPKPVFQSVLTYNLRTKKYDKKLTGVFIIPSPPHEYVLLENDLLMGLSDNRSHFVIWSLHTGHVVHRIRTSFKEFERQRLERGETPNEIPIVKRATTAKMLAWDRRAETKADRQKRRDAEMEDERKRIEEIKMEKENAIDQYIISGDFKVIVVSFFAHHLCVFDMPTHSHRTTLENSSSMMFLYIAALTHTGSYLAQANYDEETKTSYVTLWNCLNGQVKRRLKNESDVCAIAVASDGERVVFGKSNNELRIWDPMRQNSVRRIKGYPGLKFGIGSKIFVVENDTRALVFAGDISLWDLERATVLAVFTPDMKIQCCSVSLDGQVMAFGLLESSDVVVLKLVSKDLQAIQDNQGEELFGETTGDTSDEDEDDEDN